VRRLCGCAALPAFPCALLACWHCFSALHCCTALTSFAPSALLRARLLNFSVVDEAGELQHLDRLELLKKPISLTGERGGFMC
jgi:hypothetical protein